MKQLLVNADDFGFSIGINQGIEKTIKDGIVTSASVLVNTPAVQDALTRADTLGLSIGLHANLTLGTPICDPQTLPSLVDSNGCFFNKTTFVQRLFFGQINLNDVKRELNAQLKVLSDVRIDHINSHHHIHALPPLASIFSRLAKDANGWLRRPQHLVQHGSCLTARLHGWTIGTGFALCRYSQRLFCTDFFCGLEFYRAEDKSKNLLKLLRYLPDGVTELMVHPGFTDSLEIGRPIEQRRAEVDALCDPQVKQALQDQDIELVTFYKF